MPEQPEHQCKQEMVIKFMQDRMQNGNEDFRELRKDVKTLLQEVATLKERARNWGALAGMVGGGVVAVIVTVVAGFIKAKMF